MLWASYYFISKTVVGLLPQSLFWYFFVPQMMLVGTPFIAREMNIIVTDIEVHLRIINLILFFNEFSDFIVF